LQLVGLTNRGRERARNEDSYFLKADSGMALLVVADGMGGHLAGNVASGLAVSSAEQTWADLDRTVLLAPQEACQVLSNLILSTNNLILDEAIKSSDKRGMGTTLTSGLLCGNHLTIAHIGDSRAYLIYNGDIKQLTKDHSLVEHLIETGQVKPEEAQNHPQRHVITRALGIDPDPEIDIFELDLEAGSTLLFCTDGLTNLVRDDEILAQLQESSDPQSRAESLIDLANSRGGHDNITVLIINGIGGQEA